MLVGLKTEVLNDFVGIFEVTDEIDNDTHLFADEPSESSPELLEKYTLGFSRAEKK